MHIALLTACFTQKVRQLRDEEEGLALTEYLLLLGLLIGGIIVAVQGFGTGLNNGWQAWSTWIGNQTNATTGTLVP